VQDAKGAYVFSAFNHAFSRYILELRFTTFDNLKPDPSLPYYAEVQPGSNKLFSLYPVNANDPVKFIYSIDFHKGCLHQQADTNFTYLLPVSPGKETQVYEMTNPDKPAAGGGQLNNWYVLRLKMRPGDTIYASRKGIVTEVEDHDGSNDAGAASAGKENYIEIVQADCSFGHYGILRKNSAMVRPGQPVKPGQPIGLVGGDQYGRGSEIRFSVYYNQEEDLQGSENIHQHSIRYVHLKCWTKNNGRGELKHGAMYTGEFPLSVLTQEADKKNKRGKLSKKPLHHK